MFIELFAVAMLVVAVLALISLVFALRLGYGGIAFTLGIVAALIVYWAAKLVTGTLL